MNDDPRLLILATGDRVTGAILWAALTFVFAVIAVVLAIASS